MSAIYTIKFTNRSKDLRVVKSSPCGNDIYAHLRDNHKWNWTEEDDDNDYDMEENRKKVQKKSTETKMRKLLQTEHNRPTEWKQ